MPDATSARPSLPRNWPRLLQATILHVLSLAHYVLVTTRRWAANGANERLRLAAKADELEHEIAMLREEIRVKGCTPGQGCRAAAAALPADRATRHSGTAGCAGLLGQTARIFQVTTATIASWSKRLDEVGPAALLRLPGAVSKFPDLGASPGPAFASVVSAAGQGKACPAAGACRVAPGRQHRRGACGANGRLRPIPWSRCLALVG